MARLVGRDDISGRRRNSPFLHEVALCLLKSAERDACRLPVTQTELAELCSVSRATVRKVMEELEARGAVACSYAELYVLSRQSILHALRDHLRSGPVGRAAQYPTRAAN